MPAANLPLAALPAAGRQPLSDQVYGSLRAAILRGDLAAGAKLTETDVGGRMGVSATPVREAFRRLAAEGLVCIAPWRGVTVQSFSRKDLIEMYQCREALEGLACRLAAEHIDAEGIRRLRALLDASRRARRAARVVEINSEIHDLIFGYARNDKLVAMLGTFQDMILRDRALTADQAKRRAEIGAEHAAILGALERRDGDDAERAMRCHVRNGFAHRLQSMTQPDR
jgi:DNA-binding GntR family transcriptional regulator